jgi:hypothetical protein
MLPRRDPREGGFLRFAMAKAPHAKRHLQGGLEGVFRIASAARKRLFEQIIACSRPQHRGAGLGKDRPIYCSTC